MSNRFFFISDAEKKQMLADIGVKTIDELYSSVPEVAFLSDLKMPPPMPEHELNAHMSSLANKNVNATQVDWFLGAGCYYHNIPATVGAIISRSEYLTAYTPYQAEVSQGLLSAMFEFQTIIVKLTGMDIANGSMYDGATALAEGVMMAHRVRGKNKIYYANKIHPHYSATVESTIQSIGMEIVDEMSDDIACIIVQYPDFFGEIVQINRELANKHNAMLIVVITEILSLGLLPPPSEADVVVGEAQSLGACMNFGGPHVGFFACKQQYLRQLPGRICGETVDANGERAFTLTISAREQHIKRGKATSNICTNQFLLALSFTVHAALLGEIGYKKLALINHERCILMVDLLSKNKKIKVLNSTFFNEFAISVSFDANVFINDMLSQGVMAGYAIDKNTLLISVTEMNSEESINRYAKLLCEYADRHA